MRVRRPCINCGQLTAGTTRCHDCQTVKSRLYNRAYRREAQQIRATTTRCWICGEGERDDDPWQADHIFAGVLDSPLAGAHRSCNIRRSNTDNR